MTKSPDRLHNSFQDALNRHDLEAIVALYECDAVLASSYGTSQGTDAIRETYRSVLGMHPAIELQTVETIRAGDLALLHGKWVLHITGPDGADVRSEGRSAETVRLQPDGRWLFVIDDTSAP